MQWRKNILASSDMDNLGPVPFPRLLLYSERLGMYALPSRRCWHRLSQQGRRTRGRTR